MAEALARLDGADTVEAYSAGSAASGVVNPDAVRVMAELGYDLGTHRSKTPTDVPPGPYDALVSMGCGDRCPAVPARHREDWPIPDPKGQDLAFFRTVRDEIRARVGRLLGELTRTED
jgi:protein-tyrosine-phosphatase